MQHNKNTTQYPSAGLLRRFAAMVYDSLLLVAVLLVATAFTLPFTDSHATPASKPWLTIYLLLVCFFFFGWFWTHGGQTLGMRAWRLRLLHNDLQQLTWRHALLRFLTALPAWCLFSFGLIYLYFPALRQSATLQWLQSIPPALPMGLGIFWLVVDNLPNNWRDRLTATKVCRLPAKKTGA